MNILKSAVVAAALLGGAFAASGANAAPAFDGAVAGPGLTQEVRLVCDEWGRCWRTPPRRHYRPHYYGPPRFVGPPRYRGEPYGDAPRWRYRHEHEHNPGRDWNWR